MASSASNGKSPDTGTANQNKSNQAKAGKDDTGEDSEGSSAGGPPQLTPEVAEKIAGVRAQVRESFGKIVMAMMFLPRYRSLPLSDLQHLVLEPLLRDRIAIAYPGGDDRPALADVAALAIWASVSEEVDAKIRDQIKGGIFPIRLKAEDWTSGDINWLLDVIAPDTKTTGSVLANFRSVLKTGEKDDRTGQGLRLHPIISKLVDEDTLKKLGVEKVAKAETG